MKLAVRLKLRVTPEQHGALLRTLRACNAAANFVSDVAFERSKFDRQELHHLLYDNLKSFDLSSQPSIRSLRKVADAYKQLHTAARDGRFGKRGSARWSRVMGKPIRFRPEAAQPFDDRCLSWQYDAQTVSIWTVDGRQRAIPFLGGQEQVRNLREFRRGETDLVLHQGDFYLVATLDVPTPATFAPRGFVGVDMGITDIAHLSTGSRFDGRALQERRRRERRLRDKLERKGTKSARRRLRARSGKAARHSTDLNHRISKTIVTEAQRSGRGVAIENLAGIRDRVRLRKPQRVTFHAWSYGQLGYFLAYKAKKAGVPFVQVNPAYTSQACSECGHVESKNRPTRETFACRSCGVTLHADLNASRNIAALGELAWGAVVRPASG